MSPRRLSLALLLVSLPALAGERLRVAVLPIKAQTGVKPEVAAVFTEQLASAVQQRGVPVMSPEDLATQLGLERQKELSGCTESSCLVEVGQALGVERIVSGTIAIVGQSVVVNLTLLNNETGSIEVRYSERVKNATEEAFLDLVPVAVNAFFPARPTPGSGLRTAAWVTLGAGVAALGTGGVFFGLARGAQGEVARGEPAPYATLQQKVAAGKQNDVIGVTALAVGGALAVTSAVLFVVSPAAPRVAFVPSAQGGAFVVGGTF